MAMRIDKKFLIIIIGSVAVAAVVIGGLVFMKTRSDPLRHVRRGETYMMEGDFKNAHSSFLRAIGKDGFEPQFYDLAVDSLVQVTPETQTDADARYGTYMGILFKKSQIVPANEAIVPLRQAIALNRATLEGIEMQPGKDVLPAFERLSVEFDGYADLPESDADKAWMLNHIYEHEWRFASLLPKSEWEDAEQRIIAMVEMDPSNAYNQYALLRARLDRAGMDLTGARRKEGERELAKFSRDLAEARKVAGDAPEFDYIEYEQGYKDYVSGRNAEPPRLDLLEDIAGRYKAEDDRWRMKEIFMRSLLLTKEQILIENPEFLLDAVAAMTNMRQKIAAQLYEFDPDDFRNKLVYITTRPKEDLENARRMAQELATSPMPNVGINARLHSSACLQAADYNFKSIYRSYSSFKSDVAMLLDDPSATEEEKEAGREETAAMLVLVEESYDAFVKMIDEGGAINPIFKLQADLDLAHAREDWDTALALVNQLVAQGVSLDSGKMLIAADVAMRAGDYGSADRFLEEVISVRPDLKLDPGFAILRLRIAMNTGDFAKVSFMGKSLINSPGSASLSPKQLTAITSLIDQAEARSDPSNAKVDRLSDVFAEVLRANAIGDAVRQREVYASALVSLENLKADNEEESVEKTGLILRLLSAWAIFEATDPEGDPEAARQYAKRMLAIDPENQVGRLIGEVAGKNRVESLRAISVLSVPNDARKRAERFWIVLRNEERIIKSQLSRAEIDPGAMTSAAVVKLKEDLDLISAEAVVAEEKVNSYPNTSIEILRYRIDLALIEDDSSRATELLTELIEVEGVSWRTNLTKARILVAMNDMQGAAAVLAASIEEGMSNANVLRAYGRYLIELGRPGDGIKSIANAYQDAPGSADIALDYSTALYRSGNATEALQVLRRSAAVGRSNVNFLRRWLALEEQIGNPDVALDERMRIWQMNPAETENAVELGKILITATVDSRRILDPKTNKPMFSPREWARLPKNDQNRHADRIRKARALQSDQIFNELINRPNPSLPVLFGYADTLEERGLRDEALEVLEHHVIENDSVGESERSIMSVDIARRLMDIAEFEEAEKWIVKARQYQPEGDPIADKSLMGLWQSKGNPKRLTNSIKNVLELDSTASGKTKRKGYLRLLIRSLLDSNEIEEANELYANEFAQSQLSEDLLLLGSLNIERARSMRQDGDMAGAEAALVSAAENFIEVEESSLGSIEPPLQLARLYDMRYQWNQNPQDIEKAIEYARLALNKRQTSWIAQELLCVLLVRDEQIDAAGGALEDFLARVPGHDEARYLLVQMYQSLGKTERAVDLCQEAVDRNPFSVPWNVRLGRLRGEQGRYNDSAEAFKRLFEMTNDVAVARFYVDSKLRRDPPDYQSVLSFSRKNVRLVRDDPYLSGGYATTLAYAGNNERAFSEFESSYQRFLESDMNPIGMQQLVSWVPRLLKASGETKDFAEKTEAFITTITNGDIDPGTRSVLANLWAAGGSDGRSKAIGHFKKIVALDIQQHNMLTQSLSNLGSLLFLEGDCEGALEIFSRALDSDDRNTASLNNMAFTRAECGDDLDQALDEISIAVELDPLNSNVMDTLGYIHFKRGDLDSAEVALRRSLARRKVASNLMHLAEVRVEQGNLDDAEILLKSAGDLSPSNIEQDRISEIIRRIEDLKTSKE